MSYDAARARDRAVRRVDWLTYGLTASAFAATAAITAGVAASEQQAVEQHAVGQPPVEQATAPVRTPAAAPAPRPRRTVYVYLAAPEAPATQRRNRGPGRRLAPPAAAPAAAPRQQPVTTSSGS